MLCQTVPCLHPAQTKSGDLAVDIAANFGWRSESVQDILREQSVESVMLREILQKLE